MGRNFAKVYDFLKLCTRLAVKVFLLDTVQSFEQQVIKKRTACFVKQKQDDIGIFVVLLMVVCECIMSCIMMCAGGGFWYINGYFFVFFVCIVAGAGH